MTDAVFSIPLSAPPGARESTLVGPVHVDSVLSDYLGDSSSVLIKFAFESLLDGDRRFNPLLLRGAHGTGKTMLARGIFSRIRHVEPSANVLLMKAIDFSRQYADATEANAVEDLRQRLRKIDLLVVDDVQHLVEKQSAQIELIHTMDHLLENGKWIVATLSDLPEDHRPLLPALSSRLASGLQVRLSIPGPDARREILNRLAQRYQLSLTDDALDLLTENCAGTVRELNSLLLHLVHEHASESIDRETAARHLHQKRESAEISLQQITKQVARYFNQTITNLRGPSRRQSTVQARGVAMYLSRELTGNTLDQIGHHFGRRDHTTVLHAYRKTQVLIQSDESTRRAVDEIRLRVGVR